MASEGDDPTGWANSARAIARTHPAGEIIEAQVAVIRAEWEEAAGESRLTTLERQRLWQRQILDAYAFA